MSENLDLVRSILLRRASRASDRRHRTCPNRSSDRLRVGRQRTRVALVPSPRAPPVDLVTCVWLSLWPPGFYGKGGLRMGRVGCPRRTRLGAAAVGVIVTAGMAAFPTGAAATDPCVRLVAAINKAHTHAQLRRLKVGLEICREEHAVSIAPENPRANETVTITIHPRWPLRKGCYYEVIITDTEGHPGDRYAHATGKKTRGLTVTISPQDGAPPPPLEGEPPPPPAEWAPGTAGLTVIEGTPRQLDEITLHPKWRAVGGRDFRFSPVG
jgi:hypothetical protein